MGQPASHAVPSANDHRKQNAERAAAQGDPFHAQQVGDGKFHADGKHQQDYADFGEHFEGVQVGDFQAGSEGADEDAAEDESEDERKLHAAGEQAADDGGEKNESKIAEENWTGFHGASLCWRQRKQFTVGSGVATQKAWQAGAQQAAPQPSISERGECGHGMQSPYQVWCRASSGATANWEHRAR